MPAISSGCATRPIGELAKKALRIFGSSNQGFVIAVSTNPGASALIRIPRLAYSIPAAFDNPITPCFAATYALMPGSAIIPAIDALLTIAPPPAPSMYSISYFNFILHREKRALQIDGDNLIERRFFNVREQTSCGQNTGVVERAVQSTVGFDRGRYKIFHVARLAHISLHKKSLTSLS